MAKSVLSVSLLILVFGLALGQRFPIRPPPLPPGRPTPPLLPPVISQKNQDLLTKQQLAFIRHHQKLQQFDKSNYNPYSCLPKYICIVEDGKGNKRTTIVNGLHPVLRENAYPQEGPKNNVNFRKTVPHLSVTDPEAFYKDRDRIHDDSFLEEQEIGEQIAIEQQKQRQSFLAEQQRKSFVNLVNQKRKKAQEKESTENESGESNEENDENGNKSGEDGSSENPPPPPPPKNRKRPIISQESPEDHQNNNEDFDNSPPIAAVPWDDRPKNDSVPSSSLVAKIKSVLPSLPGLPFMGSSNNKNTKEEPTTTTTPRPSILRRMLGGPSQFFRRGKRDVEEDDEPSSIREPYLTKMSPGIKSSDQCRILYNGCELNYDQVMQIAANGQVLIEGDAITPPPQTPTVFDQSSFIKEDDEADQAVNEFGSKSTVSPFVQYLHVGAQVSTNKKTNKKKPGTGFQNNKKVKGSKYGNSQSEFNQDHKAKPSLMSSEEDEADSLSVASLPILPMRFNFGRPKVYKNGKPQYPIFEDLDSRRPTSPPTTAPPKTAKPPPPIFVKNPIYKKINRTVTETNIIQLNATHALQIKTPKNKPYRPVKAPVLDKNGNPASFASVFTDIAGSSGGIHDYFDKIANTVGHQPTRRGQKQFPHGPQGPPRGPPPPQQFAQEHSQEGDGSDEDDRQRDEESDEEETEDDEPADDEVTEDEPEEDDDDDEPQDDEPADNSDNKSKVKETKDKTKNKPEVKPGVGDVKPKDTKYKVKGKGKDKDKSKDKAEEDEVADEEEIEDTSEEKKKRKKAAEEVELPEYLPAHIKQAIRDDIASGGKSKNQGQPSGHEGQAVSALGDDQEEDDQDQGPPQGVQGHGGPPPRRPPSYGHGPRPSYGRPPPRRGMFSSLFPMG